MREQFGRPIAMFQAVKHHCANMLVATELATAAVWDAARAAADGRRPALATPRPWPPRWPCPAADLCANLNIQVHGGIGFTWEHDAHLYLRRATALARGARRRRGRRATSPTSPAPACAASAAVDLPPEAEAIRDEVRGVRRPDRGPRRRRAARRADRDRLRRCRTGPKPWGRDAGADRAARHRAGVRAPPASSGPQYGITGWVILTLIQHAHRRPGRALGAARRSTRRSIWCQLFSEPDAGSDAAGIKTRATRVDGGWLVNGQKVWTSGAHVAGCGFATVRTNPDVPKHDGITTMVIDMHADGRRGAAAAR